MDTKRLIKQMIEEKLLEVDEQRNAAGVLIKCTSTGNVFLLLRNDRVPKWSLMSGEIEKGETLIEGLKREIGEELQVSSDGIEFKFMSTEQGTVKNMIFHYYEGFTSEEFTPKLNNENLKWGWFSKDNLPSPLFVGLDEKIAKI